MPATSFTLKVKLFRRQASNTISMVLMMMVLMMMVLMMVPLILAPAVVLARLPARQSSESRDNIASDHGGLSKFLEKHYLGDLSESYFLRRLDNASTREAKVVAAGELARFYMNRANKTADKTEFDEHLIDLLGRFPELDHQTFELGKIQAEYRLNKIKFQQWIERRRSDELRQALETRWQQFASRLDLEIANQKTLRGTDLDDTQALDNFLSQLAYVRAWTFYYYGLVSGDEQQSTKLLAESIQQFRDLLELADDQKIAGLGADWLNLASAWNARCLIGLGMAAEAANQRNVANACFEKLDGANVNPAVARERRQWRFHSFFFPGKITLAARYADQLFAEELNEFSVWSSIVIAGRVWIDPDSADARRLSLLGLAGLAKSNRFNIVRDLVDQHQINLGIQSFYSAWITSQLAFDQYSQTLDLSKLTTASEAINKAVSLSSRVEDRHSIASVKWLSALIAFKQDDAVTAADIFHQLAKQFRFSRPDLASRAMWMRIQMLEAETERQPLLRVQLASALADLHRWFPQSRYVQMAEFQQRRKQLSLLDPKKAIRQLEGVNRQSPNYELARFDIVQACYRDWKVVHGRDPTDRSSREFRELGMQSQLFLRSFESAVAARRLTCGLLYVDALLKQTPPQTEIAGEWLDRLGVDAEKTNNTNIAKGNFYFHQLNYAKAIKDAELASNSAEWLANNGSTRSLQGAGLIWTIQRKESAVDEVSQADRPALLREISGLYTDLVSRLENETTNLKTHGNLRVAVFRLAELQMEIENYPEAAKNFGRLLNAFPNNAQFLLGSAQARQFAGDRPEALLAWKKIARGATVGSDIWLEAKYYLVLALADKDREQAGRLLKQTLQLAPRMPANWNTQFDKLKRSL